MGNANRRNGRGCILTPYHRTHDRTAPGSAAPARPPEEHIRYLQLQKAHLWGHRGGKRGGKPGRPVVDSNGKPYPSVIAAARACRVSHASIHKSISTGRAFGGLTFKYAEVKP